MSRDMVLHPQNPPQIRLSFVSSLEQCSQHFEEILEFDNMLAPNKVLVGLTVSGKSSNSTLEPDLVMVIK